jgi:hypothetical protein
MFLEKIFKLFVLLTVFSLLFSCSFLGKRDYEKIISDKEEYYTIDPLHLIGAITQGDKENLFVLHKPLSDQSDMWSLPIEKSVQWDQEDYFHVVNALNEYIGNQPLEDWKVKMIYLDYDCVDTGAGFNRGLLEFFKVDDSSDKGEVRTVLTADVMPWRKIVRWYQAVYSPVLEDWGELDLKKITISAKQAIEIAEKNGGSDVRAKIANKCTVNISMIAPGSGYGGWVITYSTTKSEKLQSTNIFKILIDPKDGKFQLVIQ